MGLLFLSRHAGTWHHNTVRDVTFPAKHNALDIWPIRAHLASQNDEVCKKSAHFRKAEHRRATIMYSIWKIMRFNLKPYKHIALHQIHKIVLFLAMSYDPFKTLNKVRIGTNLKSS